MKAWIKYMSYIFRHRRYVRQECRRLKVSRWRAFKHDWSKFLPDEFGPYCDYFYRMQDWPENPRRIDHFYVGDKYSKVGARRRFDEAWLRHQHRQDHHWQHWLLQNDDGTLRALEMPLDAVAEMVADWAGAGLAIHGRLKVVEWYAKNFDKMNLHPETRRWVHAVLDGHYQGRTIIPDAARDLCHSPE